jgi:heme-degrading monooxygenase HmoA
MTTRQGSLVVINVFTPKADAMDAFLAMQIEALPRLRTMTTGARGSRLYLAEDRSRAVMVSAFDSAEDFKRFSESEPFAAHRSKILPHLESSQPGRFELVYEAGDL